MASNCKHDFGEAVANSKMMWQTMLCRSRCFYCGIKCSSMVKMTQCILCHVLVHEWCLPPVVVESSPAAASNLRGVLKVSPDVRSVRGQPPRGNGQKGRRIWHLDDLKVYGYGYHLHRELEAFLVPSRVPLEHEGIEPGVAEFFCSMAAERTDETGDATRSRRTAETVPAEEPKSADMARGCDGGSRRRGRRNRWRKTNATAAAKNH